MSSNKEIRITAELLKTLFDGKKPLLDSGKRSFFENDFVEAIATLRTLILLEKDHIEGNYFLAAAYKKNGELEEAKETWTHIRDLYPKEFERIESQYNFFLAEPEFDAIEKARKFALDFIKKHFKEEIPLFNILFDSIKEIETLEQIQTKNLVGALGITDKVDIIKKYKSPVIIKSANDTFKEIKDIKKISKKELNKLFKKNLIKNKAIIDIVSKVDDV